ncbi:MAG: hypothetical protein CXZ00_05535 [Acidobacteria bacterium]|nr:MAG: hypothetical protein CXZ00_05535 [Acidobacteriota bacterium]
MSQPGLPQEEPDFSLVLGGPIFQFFRRAHLSGSGLELLHRRIVVITLIAWLPLLILSSLSGHALGGSCTVPFLHDIVTQVRFLIALPVLIGTELIVHVLIRPVVQQFVKSNTVVAEERPKFNAAIDSAVRLRNSIPLELGLLILVFTTGHWLWQSRFLSLGFSSWYAILEGAHWRLTPAGYWNAYVSIPIFQFILMRWYLRLLIWSRFLWQVSRLNLHLIPTHPDRAAGLAFLVRSSYAFAPILFAQGTLLSGFIANRVIYDGRNLLSFKMDVIGFIGFMLLCGFGPLTMFTPQLASAKRKGLFDYGLLAKESLNR